MTEFKIIPVIDIFKKGAVHAVKGERENYKPLKSYLFDTSNPIEILKKLYENFNFNLFYIADLDAIIKKSPNFELISKILALLPIDIIIDPGIISIQDVKQYFGYNIQKLILGLETISNIEIITQSLNLFGSNKIIVSVDMYNEEILTCIKYFKGRDPKDIVKDLCDIGVESIILLDLLKVGQKLGGISPLYLKIRKIFKGEIYVGGGIKDLNNILIYKSENFSGVLIGTALYDGTIRIKDLKMLT